MKSIYSISLALLIGCMALFISPPANALDSANLNTTIVFTNSTPETIRVSLAGNAQAEQLTDQVPPLATRNLARITRTEGPKTDLSILLTTDAYKLKLIQQTGNTGLLFGAETDNQDIPLQNSTAIQRHPLTLGDDACTLAFNGSGLDKGGKLTYVLQKHDTKPESGGANRFSVLSYNIWATTIYGSKKVDTRLDEMPAVMSGYDALVLTEVFDLAPTRELLEKLRREYPYQSGEIFRAGKLMNSGTRILSRWPFEIEGSRIYDACNGIQCAATRGVIYARINKQGNVYHLFATHTQSSDDDDNRSARLAQLDEMGSYIRRLELPADEPVIMAGDFNVNKIGLPEDRDYMEKSLSALEPGNLGHTLSYDSNTNTWAEEPYLEYLDYTLVGLNNLLPESATQEIFAPRSLTEELWGEWDLSDHYAARGVFTYDSDAAPTRSPFPYIGDVVHLKTRNGHFMRAMSGGGSFISAGSDQIGTWESFRFVALDNGKVAIQARDGHYVGLDSRLFGTLKADRHTIGDGEQFELIQLDQARIALKADNGKYLRADFGGGAGLSAGSAEIGENQAFTLIRR